MPRHGEVVVIAMVNEFEVNVIFQEGEGEEWYTWAASSDLKIWVSDHKAYVDEPSAMQGALEYLFPELMAGNAQDPDEADFIALNDRLGGMAPGSEIVSLADAVKLRDKLRAQMPAFSDDEDKLREHWNGILRAVAHRYGEMSEQATVAAAVRSSSEMTFELFVQVCGKDLRILESFCAHFGA